MLERLRAVAPAAIADDDARARFAARGRQPRALLAPRSADEAAAIVALASSEGWRVQCAGAGTCLPALTQSPDIVLSTRALQLPVEYVPADLVIGVSAGMTLSTLAERVGAHRQFLPLDPPGSERSTIGAVVANGSAGPLRLAHGTPRDHVLGLQVVTGDGRVLDFGGRVVKNVAGYDIVRLLVGSRGALGLITRVHIRLKPLPHSDQTLGIVSDDEERLLDVAQRIQSARVEPVALEIISPSLVHKVTDAPPQWLLLARFQGNREAVKAAYGVVSQLAPQVQALSTGLTERTTEYEARAPLVLRLADQPARLRATLALARRLAGDQNTAHESAAYLLHAGDGIVRVLLEGPVPQLATALAEARAELVARGGTLTVQRDAEGILEGVDPHGAPPTVRDLMKQLKKVFDPAAILANEFGL